MAQIIKFKINGMHCVSCSMNIDGELEETDGIIKANTSYAKQVAEVEFDESKIDPEKIIEKIKIAGYQAEVVK